MIEDSSCACGATSDVEGDAGVARACFAATVGPSSKSPTPKAAKMSSSSSSSSMAAKAVHPLDA